MGLMRTEITVQDRVWAEFCRVVAEQHKTCCKRTPASILYEMMRHVVLEYKAQELMEAKLKSQGKKVPGKDKMTIGETIDFLINPDTKITEPTAEEDAEWNEMVALYSEGAEEI